MSDYRTEAEALEDSNSPVMIEGEVLSYDDWIDRIPFPAFLREINRMFGSRESLITVMKERYVSAEKTNVSSRFQCPTCGKLIVKNTYNKRFCRSKGKQNCKDIYWNSVDDTRRKRAKVFKKKLI